MSTNPDAGKERADDEIVSLLSEWLAFHVSNDALLGDLTAIGTDDLSPEQSDALQELLVELEAAGSLRRGDLEMLVRETLEAVALG